MKLPTLYKKSKSAWEQWTIYTGEDQDGAYFEIEYGQLNGAMQYKRNYTVGKNKGRSNETTPLKQAELEANSRWNKQRDKQYVEDMNDKPAILPMLAHKLKDKLNKVVFPCFIQPKLDGIRCLAYLENDKIVLRSRNNKDFYIPHLVQSLEFVFKNNPTIILDGELYNKDLTFQQITSLVSKYQEDSAKIEYHVYDTISNKKFSERKQDIPHNINFVVPVLTKEVTSLEEIKSNHQDLVLNGYEGSIIRHSDSGYEIGVRSNSLLKYKDFLTEEFKIIGFEQNEHRPDTCVFILETQAGAAFSAMPEGSLEHRQELFQQAPKLIGKMMTVRFFEWTSSEQPVPRFPIGVSIRDYE